MASGNALPFFLFWLKWPEVGSESEPKNLYWSSWTISGLLSCIHRTVSSCWSSVSLASSSVIFELACANFSSAFQQWSHCMEALFSMPFWHHWSDCRGGHYTTQLSCLTQRMLHPLCGELCLATLFRRLFWPPWMVFLLSTTLMLLLHVTHTHCTFHILHDVSSW